MSIVNVLGEQLEPDEVRAIDAWLADARPDERTLLELSRGDVFDLVSLLCIARDVLQIHGEGPEIVARARELTCRLVYDMPPAIRVLTGVDDPADDVRVCEGCGCTDLRACDGGCYWATPTLCSKCAGQEPLPNLSRDPVP